jgi:hypothetical protein
VPTNKNCVEVTNSYEEKEKKKEKKLATFKKIENKFHEYNI